MFDIRYHYVLGYGGNLYSPSSVCGAGDAGFVLERLNCIPFGIEMGIF